MLHLTNPKVGGNWKMSNSNLIWRTVSCRVDDVIPSDHPRHEASKVRGISGTFMTKYINFIFRPVARKMLFKVLFFIFSSDGHFFSGGEPVMQLWLRHYGEHSCEIILNLNKWFMIEEMSFKDNLHIMEDREDTHKSWVQRCECSRAIVVLMPGSICLFDLILYIPSTIFQL